MNTYDFDKTIFYPDSSVCFFRYCLRHFPAAVVPTLPSTAVMMLRYAAGKADMLQLKQQLFSFLKNMNDTEKAVQCFWREYDGHIGTWYLRQKREDDLVVSASPRFLLAPICEKLGVELIATEMDSRSGKITGANCHDREKVRRFFEHFPDGHIETFYSDSLSDSPMAGIADHAYLVKKQKILPWPEKTEIDTGY